MHAFVIIAQIMMLAAPTVNARQKTRGAEKKPGS
jgi:hypothetical protein